MGDHSARNPIAHEMADSWALDVGAAAAGFQVQAAPSAKATSPYQDLPPQAFWNSAVRQHVGGVPPGLYTRQYEISPDDQIATAGSCFAQHIARHLRQRGYKVIDAEPPPPYMTKKQAQNYGYLMYSARYGNIYTARQLLQLTREALGQFTPADAAWEKDGRWYDALRPGVEPHGLPSPESVYFHRAKHLEHVRRVFETVDVFVFTLGLTEAWEHRQSGTIYPTAPGTIAGTFEPGVHRFRNFTHAEILADVLSFRDLLRGIRPQVRFLLTVSPVPLTATAADNHVLAATTYSKSVLRGVAGEVQAMFEDVDYFPSYEIITNPFLRSDYYEENRRSVSPTGVEAVMQTFFSVHQLPANAAAPAAPGAARRRQAPASRAGDVVCEEALLEAFGE